MPVRPIALAVALLAGAVGCAAASTLGPPPSLTTPVAGASQGRWVAPGVSSTLGCRAVNGLPDVRCTPGATDPAVTEDTIGTTICVAGYSARVRPPVSVTEPIKRAEMRAYGLSGPLSAVELDHLVPLSVGGAPAAVANLWPENRSGSDGAQVKDTLELRLHALICARQLLLPVAQQAIATDWRMAYRHYVGSVVASGGNSD